MTSRRLLSLDPFPTVPSCRSTQELCRALVLEGAPEGTTVSALEQTAGRGRGDRTWHSPAGLGLWMSLVLRPRKDPSEWPALTAWISLALAETLESLPGAPPGWKAAIKWPNDVLGFKGKLAGILAETARDAVIVGLGLNLGQTEHDFLPELRRTASSLRLEGFDPVPEPALAAAHLNERLTWHYDRFQNGERDVLRAGLLERFYLREAWVQIECAGKAIEGRAIGLGPAGELLLEAPGEAPVRAVLSGQVMAYSLPSRGEDAPGRASTKNGGPGGI